VVVVNVSSPASSADDSVKGAPVCALVPSLSVQRLKVSVPHSAVVADTSTVNSAAFSAAVSFEGTPVYPVTTNAPALATYSVSPPHTAKVSV
jgi:hypothetical protein